MLTLRRRAARVFNAESGISLVSTIGIVMMVSVLTLLVVGATMSAFSATGTTQSSVRASASAEAGAAAAHAAVDNGTCVGDDNQFSSGEDPFYRAVVMAGDPDSGYEPGCPSDSQHALVVSTGYGTQQGYENRSGKTHHVEVELDPLPEQEAGEAGAPPAAGLFGNAGTFNGVEITGDHKDEGNFKILEGNVTCSNADIAGNLYAPGGSITTSQCHIGGDLFAGGVIDLAGNVGGNVISEGTGTTLIHPWATNEIGGDLRTRGPIRYDGNPGCEAGWNSPTSAQYACQMQEDGLLLGGYRVEDESVSGPQVSGWMSLKVAADDFPSTHRVQQWEGSCNIDNNSDNHGFLMEQLEQTRSDGQPVVLDALEACGSSGLHFSTSWSGTHSAILGANVVFLANGFNLEGLRAESVNGSHEILFIHPDGSSSGGPSCGGGNSHLSNGVDIDAGSGTSAFIYTPCQLQVSNDDNWRGQMVAGTIQFHASATYEYVRASSTSLPEWLPDYDGGSGGSGGGGTADGLREVLDIRDSNESAEDYM
ncbi:hypothetical protein [Nesterenkonia populi]|uniref:hypothetical protein n=1 Tax=Nesterenkonia populi TaxID=1591087 RepID=UPI0011BF7ADE|nr:hypothetical protein [Nesterenkonia populi]